MNKAKYIFPSLIFCLLSSLFFFGCFSKDYKVEKFATSIADTALTTRHNTTLGIKVESISSEPLLDQETEYKWLYRQFHKVETFAGVGNSNKEIDFKFEDIEDSKTLSFFRFGYAESIVYNNQLRHKRYPIELMFEDKPFYDNGYENIITISQTHADSLLKARGKIAPYSCEDYKSLTLNDASPTPINLTYGDGQKYECYIANIYKENFNNIYFDYLHEIIDDFVITYKTLPNKVRKENLYFFNTYSYQNKTFIDHINKSYKEKDSFKLSIVTNNLTNSVTDESLLLGFFSNDIYLTNWVAILVTIITAIGCLIVSLLSTFKFKYYKSKLFNLVFAISLLLPYTIFWIANSISKSTMFFSWFSTTANIITALCVVLLYLASIAIQKLVLYKKENSNNER